MDNLGDVISWIVFVVNCIIEIIGFATIIDDFVIWSVLVVNLCGTLVTASTIWNVAADPIFIVFSWFLGLIMLFLLLHVCGLWLSLNKLYIKIIYFKNAYLKNVLKH